jgi:hypothetical protein
VTANPVIVASQIARANVAMAGHWAIARMAPKAHFSGIRA